LEPFVRDDRRPDLEQMSAKMDFYRIDPRNEGFLLTLDGHWTNSARRGELDWDSMRRSLADDLHAIYDAWQQGNRAIILVARTTRTWRVEAGLRVEDVRLLHSRHPA
jgi:hypothetical protein